MARTKVNDLEIIIKAKNEAQKAMGEVKKDLGDIEKLTKIATGAMAGLGAGAVAGLGALALNGEQVAMQLKQMGVLLGTGTQEAGALFSVIREQNPTADIDALSDGVLTLNERFSEARVESGELFAFSKDFGFEFDATISGAREQTLEFLKALRQLPDENDRVTTAIAVMGDEGARQFNKIARDAELLDATIVGLETNVDGLFDAGAAQDIDDFAAATGRLDNSFDNLSLTIFGMVDGPWASFKNSIADTFDGLDGILDQTNSRWAGALAIMRGETPPEGSFFGTDSPDPAAEGPIEGLSDSERARAALEAHRSRQIAQQAAEKAQIDAIRAAEKMAKADLKIQRDSHAAIEKAEDEFLEKQRQKQIDHYTLIEETMAFRREQGFVDTPNIDGVPTESPTPQLTEGGFNQSPIAFNDAAIEENEARVKAIQDQQDELQGVRDDTLLVADAFGALEGAIAGFSDTFLSKGSRAFKAFIALQAAAATASAYSAAAQALADFSNLSTAGKITAGLKVLGIGLGWATQIEGLASASSSAGSVATASPSTPNIPQAPDVPEQSNTGGTLNVTVASRTLNDLISVDVVQGIFDLAKEIPGGASDINFNQVLSG